MKLGVIPKRNSAAEYISILLKSLLLTRINVICASVHLPSFATHELYSLLPRAGAAP